MNLDVVLRILFINGIKCYKVVERIGVVDIITDHPNTTAVLLEAARPIGIRVHSDKPKWLDKVRYFFTRRTNVKRLV